MDTNDRSISFYNGRHSLGYFGGSFPFLFESPVDLALIWWPLPAPDFLWCPVYTMLWEPGFSFLVCMLVLQDFTTVGGDHSGRNLVQNEILSRTHCLCRKNFDGGAAKVKIGKCCACVIPTCGVVDIPHLYGTDTFGCFSKADQRVWFANHEVGEVDNCWNAWCVWARNR